MSLLLLQELVPPLRQSKIVFNTLLIVLLALSANWAIISQLQPLAQLLLNALELRTIFARNASRLHTVLMELPALNVEIMV
jgi:hypothetical protein